MADDVRVHETATLKVSIEGGTGDDTLKTDFGPNMKLDPAADMAILVQGFQN